MPLPLLFIGVAAATGTMGVGKSIKAGMDASTAKKLNTDGVQLVSVTHDFKFEDPDGGTAWKVPYILIVAVISSSKFRSRSR